MAEPKQVEVNIDFKNMQSLLVRSKQIGTEDAWISVALDWMRAAEAEVMQLRKENKHLRASTAMSGGPCLYCNLPKEKWVECKHGIPGCPRGDDAMLCPQVGAALEAEEKVRWLLQHTGSLNEWAKEYHPLLGGTLISFLEAKLNEATKKQEAVDGPF